LASSFSCFLSASNLLSGGLRRAKILCPDIGRGCRMKPCIKSVIVPNKSATLISTFGKHFPFESRNAAQIEDRDNEEDCTRRVPSRLTVRKKGILNLVGTLLYCLVLTICFVGAIHAYPALSITVAWCFVALRNVADLVLSVICAESRPQSFGVEYDLRISGANTQG
jgi:hypothetical protein